MENIFGWLIIGFLVLPTVLKLVIFILTLFVPKEQQDKHNVAISSVGSQPFTREEVLQHKEEYRQYKAKQKDYFNNKIRPTLDKTIGNTTPNCPYCDFGMKKMPVRAAKCKSCGNTFFVRTRPYDDVKIVCTEKDIKRLEQQQEKINFMHELGDEYFKYEKKLQQARNTDKIPPRDVMWNKISEDMYKAEVKQDVRTLSQTLWKAGHFLVKEKKYRQGLEYLLLHTYYTANEHDPWVSFNGDMGKCVQHLKLSKAELVDFFLNIRPIINTNVSLMVFVPNLEKAYDEYIQENKIQ